MALRLRFAVNARLPATVSDHIHGLRALQHADAMAKSSHTTREFVQQQRKPVDHYHGDKRDGAANKRGDKRNTSQRTARHIEMHEILHSKFSHLRVGRHAEARQGDSAAEDIRQETHRHHKGFPH